MLHRTYEVSNSDMRKVYQAKNSIAPPEEIRRLHKKWLDLHDGEFRRLHKKWHDLHDGEIYIPFEIGWPVMGKFWTDSKNIAHSVFGYHHWRLIRKTYDYWLGNIDHAHTPEMQFPGDKQL